MKHHGGSIAARMLTRNVRNKHGTSYLRFLPYQHIRMRPIVPESAASASCLHTPSKMIVTKRKQAWPYGSSNLREKINVEGFNRGMGTHAISACGRVENSFLKQPTREVHGHAMASSFLIPI
jgi:hypothetical protein